jgi:hypothetical protein
MKVWIVEQGFYYADGWHVDSVHSTKKGAELQARADGFKWNKEDDMFLNESKQLWRQIHSKEVIEVKNNKSKNF